MPGELGAPCSLSWLQDTRQVTAYGDKVLGNWLVSVSSQHLAEGQGQ